MPRKKKYVTLETFLRKLRKTKAKWRVDEFADIRCASGLCPLEKVFGLPKMHFEEAPLRVHDRILVVGAADNDPSPRFRNLRPRLLRACGLTEWL